MRPAFSVSVPHHHLAWREIRSRDAWGIYTLFRSMIKARAQDLSDDTPSFGYSFRDYTDQAREDLFSLRKSYWLKLHPLLPLLTPTAFALRLRQKPEDLKNGLVAGLHIAVLWNTEKKRICGVGTLERDKSGQAEFSCWMAPDLDEKAVDSAALGLMHWGKAISGYTSFLLKSRIDDAGAKEHAMAERLGFRKTALRSADAPNGNGWDTQIFTLTLD